jgi:hypothetical protein
VAERQIQTTSPQIVRQTSPSKGNDLRKNLGICWEVN